MEKLTQKEKAAMKEFIANLDVRKRHTERQVIVAFVGLVGSGKISVARELAGHIGATVISGDKIRIVLRKQNERYEHTRAIAEDAAIGILKQGGNVILDSDFVDDKKRASIREKARKAGVRLVFIRVCCDIDIAIGRIINASYKDGDNDFFGGAFSKWNGSAREKGAVVKMREMWRRTPHHYRWVNEIGGRWVLRKFPFAFFAEIDTSDEKWKEQIRECAKQL